MLVYSLGYKLLKHTKHEQLFCTQVTQKAENASIAVNYVCNWHTNNTRDDTLGRVS